MDETLHRLLTEAVGRYLDGVEQLAARQHGAVATELRRLSASWRAVLRLHQPGARACAGCGRSHRARRSGLCAVWRVAEGYFVRRLPGEGVDREHA